MKVFVVEPYYGGSHRQWADGYRDHSSHDVHLITHDARFWKWRMEGAHVTLAEAVADTVNATGPPDAIVASSMVNLPAFLGATRRAVGDPATVLFMHENQLTYPASHLAQEDLTHAMINWASVAIADSVWFNSPFHLEDFFTSLPELLGRFPDYRHTDLVGQARARSSVQPVGVDLRRFDRIPERRTTPPVVLWNQRWEHDKNPGEFFGALDVLATDGVDFRVALAGEAFSTIPGEFEAARERLGDRVIHFGYAEPDVYNELLRCSDVVVSTALHEFFGVAIVEATYAGASPVLPNRLSYPGHFPESVRSGVLYDDFDGLVRLLREAIEGRTPSVSHLMARYDWGVVAPAYDAALEELAG